MGIDDLAPANTKKAKDNAVRAFVLFLDKRSASYVYVKECMLRENTIQCMVALLDKFDVHLAFKDD